LLDEKRRYFCEFSPFDRLYSSPQDSKVNPRKRWISVRRFCSNKM